MRCVDVRDQINADTLCCLYPIETEAGFRVNTLVTFRGIELYLKWFEERGISLFVKDGSFLQYIGRKINKTGCPPKCNDMCYPLTMENKIIFLHSVFDQFMRKERHEHGNNYYEAWAVCNIANIIARFINQEDLKDIIKNISRIIKDLKYTKETIKKGYKNLIKLRKFYKKEE